MTYLLEVAIKINGDDKIGQARSENIRGHQRTVIIILSGGLFHSILTFSLLEHTQNLPENNLGFTQ